jgi:hypothetical protein
MSGLLRPMVNILDIGAGKYKRSALHERIPVNETATFKAEVQFDKKDMARNIIYSSYRCMLDSIFCGKTEGIESDTAK